MSQFSLFSPAVLFFLALRQGEATRSHESQALDRSLVLQVHFFSRDRLLYFTQGWCNTLETSTLLSSHTCPHTRQETASQGSFFLIFFLQQSVKLFTGGLVQKQTGAARRLQHGGTILCFN